MRWGEAVQAKGCKQGRGIVRAQHTAARWRLGGYPPKRGSGSGPIGSKLRVAGYSFGVSGGSKSDGNKVRVERTWEYLSACRVRRRSRQR